MNRHREGGVGDIGERQAGFNASSRAQWDAFAGHRHQVTALIARGGGRICVLGVGNGNDLDLGNLLEGRREVHLVDVDRAALHHAAASQGVAGHRALRLHGGVDVTGLFDVIGNWSPLTSIGPSELSALVAWPSGRVAPVLPGGFNLVASTCLLSQLMETACHSLGKEHPKVEAAENAIRDGHLRLLARMAAPGGSVVVVTEVACSETLPGLGAAPERSLPDLLERLEREGNHFRGVHPSAMVAAVRRDPELRPLIAGVEVSRPWKWRLHDHLYLVWALTLRIAMHAER